jgi:rod shape-determining protein MreD
MVEQRGRGYWVILFSFSVAMVLSLVTIPNALPWEFGFLRPDWVLLVLVYWVIALPHRVGALTAWVLGLVMDVLLGTLIGQHALIFLIVVYIAENLYQRLRMFAVWQQSMVVFALIGLAHLLGYWVDRLVGVGEWSWWLLLPPVVSAFVWPWMFLLLRALRRFFAVA